MSIRVWTGKRIWTVQLPDGNVIGSAEAYTLRELSRTRVGVGYTELKKKCGANIGHKSFIKRLRRLKDKGMIEHADRVYRMTDYGVETCLYLQMTPEVRRLMNYESSKS